MAKLKQHEKCLLCERPLKSVKSRIEGYGPVCLKKRQTIETTAGTRLNHNFPDPVAK